MEAKTEQKVIQKLEQPKETKSWVDDDQIFDKWKNYPSDGCYLELANIKKMKIKEGYWIPCGKPDVMDLNIPGGSRAGARPCGATWKAFGGIYYQGSTQRAYCTRCWYAYCLNEGINVPKILKDLKIERQ